MSNLEDFKYVTINFHGIDYRTWFYNTGCQYPLVVPDGTKVEFVSVLHNYYGIWYEVKHNNELKYISPCYCEGNIMVKMEEIKSFDVRSLTNNVMYIYTDRYGKKYRLLNNKEELELLYE